MAPRAQVQRKPPTSLLKRLLVCCTTSTTSPHDLEDPVEEDSRDGIADQPGATTGTRPTAALQLLHGASSASARMHDEADEHPRTLPGAAPPAGPPTPQAAAAAAVDLTTQHPRSSSAFAAAASSRWPPYEPSATRSADAARSSARLQLQQELAARPQQDDGDGASLDAQCWPLSERLQPEQQHAVATDAPLPPIVEAAGEAGSSTSASNAAPVTPPPAVAGLEQAPTFSLPIPVSPVSPAAAAAALEAAGNQTDSAPGSDVAATTPQSTPDASSSQPGLAAAACGDDDATPPASPPSSSIPASPFTSPRAQAAVTSELRHDASPRGRQQQQQLEALCQQAVVTQFRPARSSSWEITPGTDPSRVWALIAQVGSSTGGGMDAAAVAPRRAAAAHDATSQAEAVAAATAAAAAAVSAQPPDQQHVCGSSAGSATSLPDAPPGLRKIRVGKSKAPIAVSTESNVVTCSGPHAMASAALGQQQRGSNDSNSSAGSNRLSSEHSSQHQHQQHGRDELVPTYLAVSSHPGSSTESHSWQQQQLGGLPRIQTSRWAGHQQPAAGGRSPSPPPLPRRPKSSTSLAGLGANSSSNSASSAGNTHNFYSGATAYFTAPNNALHAAHFPASPAAAAGSAADGDVHVWGPFARHQQRQQRQREQTQQHWQQQQQQQQRHSLSSEGDERTAADEWEVLPVVLTPLKVPRSHVLDDVLADTPRTSVVGVSNSVIDVMLSEEGIPLVPTSGRYSRDDEFVSGLNSPFLSLPVNALFRHSSGSDNRHDQQQHGRQQRAAAAAMCGTPRRFGQSTSGDFFAGRTSADLLPPRQRRLSAGFYSSHRGGAPESLEGLHTAPARGSSLASGVGPGNEQASIPSSHWFGARPSVTDSELLRHQQQQLQVAGTAVTALGGGGSSSSSSSSSRAGRTAQCDDEPPSTPRGSAISLQWQQQSSVSSPVTVAAARAKAIAAAVAQSAAVGTLVGTGAAAAARRDSSEAGGSSTSSNAVATSSSNLASGAALFSRSGWAAIGHQLPGHNQLQHLSAGQPASLFATPQRPPLREQASAVLPAPPQPLDEL